MLTYIGFPLSLASHEFPIKVSLVGWWWGGHCTLRWGAFLPTDGPELLVSGS